MPFVAECWVGSLQAHSRATGGLDLWTEQSRVPDLTIFIAGDRNVVHCPKFETGSREHLELHGAQDKGLEIWRRSRREREHHCGSPRTYCSSLGASAGRKLSSRVGHWKGGKVDTHAGTGVGAARGLRMGESDQRAS